MLLAGVKGERLPGEWILRINSYVNSTESVFWLFNAEKGFTQKKQCRRLSTRATAAPYCNSQHQCSHAVTINMSSKKKCYQSLAVRLSTIGANGQPQQSCPHRARVADATEAANKQSFRSFAAGSPDVGRNGRLQHAAAKAAIGGIREGVCLLEKDGRKKSREKAKSRGQTKTSTKKWCKSAGGGRVLKNEKTVKSKSKSGGPSKRGGSGSASSNNKKWIKIAGDG